MKTALSLCALACNPASPSPTASMVRVEGGFMQSFGGLFSISVPVEQDLGVAFNPSSMKTFFRKSRKVVSYTVNKKKLTLKEGKEHLTIGCLPAEDLVFLDVIAPTKPCSLDLGLLKYLSDIIDPADFRASAHGVTSRDEMLLATNNRVFGAAYVEGLPDFNLHKDSCVALSKFKTKVVSYATDGRAIKFNFDDGSSLCSLNIAEALPNVAAIFEEEWVPLGIKDAVVKDMMTINADYFTFANGNIQYHTEDRSSLGEIEAGVHKDFNACTMKAVIHFLLRNGGDISYAKSMNKLRSVNGEVCVITSLMQNEGEVTK